MTIYNRERDLIDTVDDQAQDISDIKQSQILGYDNLVVKNYFYEINPSLSIAPNVYAEWTATFTYDNPPSDALVIMSFDYSFNPNTANYFITEYAPAGSVTSSFERKYILRVACLDNTITSAFISSHVNSTEPGSLSVVRTL